MALVVASLGSHNYSWKVSYLLAVGIRYFEWVEVFQWFRIVLLSGRVTMAFLGTALFALRRIMATSAVTEPASDG